MQTPVIRPRDLEIVREILSARLPENTKIWVFGSRAKDTEKRAADLDLAIDAGRPLNRREETSLADAFDESDLPYTVDIVDLHTVSDTFKAVIEQDRVPLPPV